MTRCLERSFCQAARNIETRTETELYDIFRSRENEIADIQEKKLSRRTELILAVY